MAELVTLELPERITQQAREVARLTQRRFEDVLVAWMDRAIHELPVESLPDEQVLALCDLEMELEQQQVLGELLEQNREGTLTKEEAQQFEGLMQVYRKGLVRKANALKVAVERGLRPALQ